ncbi:MAG TPA: hypothetical protein VFU68_05030 [Terracidiphilus sp.]|nr:hypothetical protein [Terracidiphilus sp.]
MKLWTSARTIVLLAFVTVILLPAPARAIPAFARKYGVRCYTCHTIPPALNKTGYMFKRLGYRMPPDDMDGSKPAPKVSALDKDIKFSLTNSFALLLQTSVTGDNNIVDNGDGTKTETSSSSFNLDEAALFIAGTIPDTGFSYFGHYELYQDGGSGLEQGFGVYTGGRANNSFFVKGGQIHLQEGEGTRAAMFYNLFPEPAYTLTNTDPLGVSLDQAPVGVDFGYTWASKYFEKIFAVSAKVTNGLDASGSPILQDSTTNDKDVWVDADYWFGPDGGVTGIFYRGKKDQVQNAGAENEFTFRPSFYRVGFMGNYYFFDKLDVLGGYIHSHDDWQWDPAGPMSDYTADTYRGEVDYYPRTGTAFMARIDRQTQKIAPQPSMATIGWGLGVEQALTERGNVVARAAYTQEHDGDPLGLTGSTDKLFRLDFRFMW